VVEKGTAACCKLRVGGGDDTEKHKRTTRILKHQPEADRRKTAICTKQVKVEYKSDYPRLFFSNYFKYFSECSKKQEYM
jgi:hypothetical protein